MKILLTKSAKTSDDMFLWSVDGCTWQKIHMYNITIQNNGAVPDILERLCPTRDLNSQATMFIAVFEGYYDHDKHVLTLKKAKGNVEKRRKYDKTQWKLDIDFEMR